jgi:hypothetical protein
MSANVGGQINTDNYVEVNGVLRPRVTRFTFFVDDGGAPQEEFVGYTIVVLDDFSKQDVESGILGVLQKYRIEEFHAEAVNPRNLRKYDDPYTDLIDSFLSNYQRASLRYCTSRLGPRIENYSNLGDICKLTERILEHLHVTVETKGTLARPVSYVALPLIEFANSTKVIQDSGVTVALVIDRTSNYDTLANESFALGGSIVNIIPFNEAVQLTVNAMLKERCRSSLHLSSVLFGKPENSVILQFVDTVANFSLNFIRCQVDHSAVQSPARVFKAAKFEYLLKQSGISQSEIQSMKSTIAQNWSYTGGKFIARSDKPISLFRLF